MPNNTTIDRLQLLTGDAEIAAAVAAGVAAHGTAFSLYVTTVASDEDLTGPRMASSFGRRYLGSFTDHTNVRRFLREQFQEAATLTGHATLPSEEALVQALSLLHIIETADITYVFTRSLSADPPPDIPGP